MYFEQKRRWLSSFDLRRETFTEIYLSCTRLRILLNTNCRKPGFNSLSTPLNHGAEQASNETLKQTQQRNWSNASQGGQTALNEHFAVLHYETASTTQQPRGEHRGTVKDCKIAGVTTWQGQGNHTFTTHPCKNGSQNCLISKNGAQGLQKNTWRPVLEVKPKKDLIDLCGRKFVGKSCTKTFSGKFGEIREKSLAPLKICLLLHQWWKGTSGPITPLLKR